MVVVSVVRDAVLGCYPLRTMGNLPDTDVPGSSHWGRSGGGWADWRQAVGRLPDYALARIEPSEHCWIWTAHVYSRYGIWTGKPVEGRPRNDVAHRSVWSLLVKGDIPEHLHHRCNVKTCVRPAHLSPTDLREHQAIHHPPKTACVNGHAFDEKNTYYRKDTGVRQCRACKAAVERARQARLSPEERTALNRRLGTTDRTCICCGASFTGWKRARGFCSRSCSAKHAAHQSCPCYND